MEERLEQFANSKFISTLRTFSEKLSKSPAFSTISTGLAGSMSLIMVGAVIQIIVALGGMAFKWQPGDAIYEAIYMPYKVTMGMIGLFMVFNLAFNYSKRLKSGSPVQAGFIAIVSYILVSSPVQSVTVGESTFNAINVDNLGATGLFAAIIIGLASVKISKFAIDRGWSIKMPDVVPEGIIAGFNAIIPAGLNIIFWHGLSMIISYFSGGQLTLSTLIIYLLSFPISYLVSPLGMIVILMLGQFFWFFGIHGTGVIFTVIMVPYIAAFTTNAELAAQNLPLVFSSIFLYGANGIVGGTGNTLPLVLMGLRSESKQIKAVSKASLVPGLFNINEPVIFGFPIMYNPILLVPFLLAPVVVMGFLWLAYHFNLMTYPSVLLLSPLPIGLSMFMSSLDWRNGLFPILMIPIVGAVYYPFFKIYEKELIEKEAQEEREALAAQKI